jgi:hypothetical protein
MADPLAGRTAGLVAGLVLGVAAALACLATWAWRRRHRPGAPTPVAGLALAAAGVGGAAVALGPAAGGPALPVPWPAVALAAAGAGALLADFDRRWRGRGLAPALLAISAAGIYLTVPDVEAALAALGAALPLALLGWPGPLARVPGQPPPSLGVVGALAVAGLLVGTAAAGSAGRPGAFVGALACLGVLAVEPLAVRLDPGRRSALGPPGGRRAGWSALAAQLALAAVAARVVGRPATVAEALPLAALLLGLALAVALAVASRSSWQRTAT